MSILLNYFIELEVWALYDEGCDENNLDVFNRIFTYLNFFLNSSELNIVKTFVHYFIRDDKIMDLKADPILKDLFCQLFEKLFLTPYQKNRPKGNELEFFSYLFIFKLWHYVCSTNEEKHKIERLIPLLYKFDTSLSSFIISKKYITHTYYDNGSYTIKNIKDRILKMLKTDESVNESLNETESLANTPYFNVNCSYEVPIKWLDKFSKKSGDVLIESDDDTNFSIPQSQEIAPNISDVTTIRVISPEMSRNFSDISTTYVSSNQLSSNNVEENISSVSTVHLHYPENDNDMHHDFSATTTLSVLNLDSLITECPSNSSFFTAAGTERFPSSVSDTSTTYLSCLSSEKIIENVQQNGAVIKTMNPKSASSSPRCKNVLKVGNGISHIRIIERKDYIKKGNSRRRTFSMLRDERLISKQNALKRSCKSLENGWKEIKQCSVKLKRLDSIEIEAFKNKKLPLEYFSRTYSKISSNDEQISEKSIDLNDSNISIEILEETLGSRAYLYCREVQKTLTNGKRNLRKRAKSCFSYY
ncbi:hypothetical protein ACKWTF_003889 [Chironomus riparius]